MGAGQHRLYDSLQLIYEGTDTLPKELTDKLKQIHKPSNGVRKQYQSVFEKLRATHCPPDLLEHRNTSICSLFHHYIITQTRTDIFSQLDLSKEKEFIKNFRLMNFDALKKPTAEYLLCLYNLYQGLKSYCTMVNNMIVSLQLPHLRLQLYTILWEQYQLSMPKFDKNFLLLNKSFENIYGILEPQLSIEILMAKIWGITVQDTLFEYCKEQLLQNRKLQNHNQYVADYFRSYVDMNIQIQNIYQLGRQNISDMHKFGNLVEAINKQSLEIYDCKQEDILTIYNSDIQYLKSTLPEWIITNYCIPTIFDKIDTHIQIQVKDSNCHIEGKSDIMVSSFYSNEFNTLEDAIRKNSQVSGISTEVSQLSQLCSQYVGTHLEHLCSQYDKIKTNHKYIRMNCENRATNGQKFVLNYFDIYDLKVNVTDQMVVNILQEIKNKPQPPPQQDAREIVLIQFTKF